MRIMLRFLAFIVAGQLAQGALKAQTGFRWSFGAGSNLYEEGAMDVDTDPFGNVYVAAYYQDGAVFLDSTLSANGGSDLLVAKLDPYGNLLWLDHRGNTVSERATSIFAAADGSVFMSGYGKVSSPFRHNRDALAARYRPDGSLAWGRYMDGDEYGEGWEIVADPNMDSYMCGTIKTKGWYGTDTLQGHGGKDAYVLKFDSTGNKGWHQTIGGTGDDEARAIAIDIAGNLYVAGYFSGTADFGGGLSKTATGSIDGFIAKYNPNGNALWVQSFGGNQTEDVKSVKVAPDGSIYFVGDFTGTFSTPAGTLASQDFYDMFYGKMNPNGTLAWIQSAGGPNMQLSQDLELDADENIYLGGIFFGSLQFGPHTVYSGLYDNLFLAKLDSSGTAVFLEDGYFAADSRGIGGLCVDAGGNVSTCGYFSQELTLGADTLHSVNNTTDLFVAKYATLDFAVRLDSIVGSPYCSNDRFRAYFTIDGLPEQGNEYLLMLSDATGNFAQADTVGGSASALGGIMEGIVPGGLPFGTGYRFKVRASNPNMDSNDNGQDITLDPNTSIPVTISGDTVVCAGIPVLLLVDSGFTSQVWSTGDTTHYLIVSSPGLYWVEAQDANGCTNRDEQLVTACVGLDVPRVAQSGLKAWPNPAGGSINISLEGTQPSTIQLLDMTGRTLWEAALRPGTILRLDTRTFPRGTYILGARNAIGRTGSKLIILQ